MSSRPRILRPCGRCRNANSQIFFSYLVLVGVTVESMRRWWRAQDIMLKFSVITITLGVLFVIYMIIGFFVVVPY